MKAFPGVGTVPSPRLIASLGSQRDRYVSAYQIQGYSGIAPGLASSGRNYHVHCRWTGSAFRRQTSHVFAQESMADRQWARE